MGGFGDAVSSPMMQYGMQGLTKGMQTGAGIANAKYNAAAARMQAKAINQQSDIQAWLIREQYATEYKALRDQQNQQQSMNRVLQAKHGMTGASASEVMSSYAAKAQKNLEVLYYNAAMKTGQQSLAASTQREAMLEKARQYDWQAWQVGVAGVMNFGSGMLNEYAREMKGTTESKPYANLEVGKPDPVTEALAEFQTSQGLGAPGTVTTESGLTITPLTE